MRNHLLLRKQWRSGKAVDEDFSALVYFVMMYLNTAHPVSLPTAMHVTAHDQTPSIQMCYVTKAALTCLAWIIVHLSGHKQLFGQIMVYKESE